MTLQDYLKPDKDGWTELHHVAHSGNFAPLIEELKSSGEHLTAEHFFIDTVEKAKGWTPAQSAGRGGHLKELAEALQVFGESLTSEHYVRPGPEGKTLLQEAMNTHQLKTVVKTLLASGERLTADHFVIKDDAGQTTLFDAVIYGLEPAGHLPEVVAALRAFGGSFTAAHFLQENRSGGTPLNGAVVMGRLNQIFTPSVWQGQLKEMMKLWEHVDEKDRAGIDFEKVIRDTIQLSVDAGPKAWPQDFSQAKRADVSTPSTLENHQTISR